MEDVTAVLDACVLYPAPLRDFLMNLAVADAFRAKWTNQIHEEWTRNLLADRSDLTADQLARTVRLMNENTRDSLVENYEYLIDTLELPDANDRHVLAAAIHAEAGVIVTLNLLERVPQHRVLELLRDELADEQLGSWKKELTH